MMRSSFLLALCAILLTDPINAAENAVIRSLNAGENLDISIFNVNDVEKCYLESPSGNIVEFIPNDQSSDKFQKYSREYLECGVQINNLEESDSGSWVLHADFSSGSRTQMYNITVNPMQADNDNRIVEYLTAQDFNTSIGAEHEVEIREVDTTFQTTESCNILTPSGMQYSMNTFNMDGVELYSNDSVSCGVKIKVQNEDVVGQWTLISTVVRLGDRVERRLPFTIHVEEIVDTHVKEINLVEGSDFYIRLRNAINEYDTCKLIGPYGHECGSAERDSRYTDTCGFVVKNIQTHQEGTWQIIYGNSIIYRAPFVVSLSSGVAIADSSSDLTLTLDRPVSINVGPENVIYCRVQDPQGFLVSERFGRCNITLDRVTMEHQGQWKISYGIQGQVLTTDATLNVQVAEAEAKPVVATSVVSNKPTVTLTCSVSSPHPVRTCKFRDPSGRVLIAAEGIGESRYSFHGSGISYSSGVHTHDCGIQITDPVVADLGLWRCGVETEGETYYGFLSALCPWALRDPEVAAEVITEPVLTADRDTISAVVGDSVSMSCSVQSAIRYCYFRARNGTIFNVGPDQSHDVATYLGAGLDAGECGIRFPTLAVGDTGAWSCHVGLAGDHHEEQRASIAVTVHDSMVVEQHMVGSQLHVEGQVYGQSTLEYCRFVRIDGVGFTGEDDNVPAGYISTQSLANGRCGLVVENPTMLDHHPWTVVARIKGQEELSRVTAHTIDMPVGDVDPESEGPIVVVYYGIPYAWIIIMSAGLILILIATLFGPEKNRRRTFNRATAIRDSFRRSFVKKKIEQSNIETSTAIAA